MLRVAAVVPILLAIGCSAPAQTCTKLAAVDVVTKNLNAAKGAWLVEDGASKFPHSVDTFGCGNAANGRNQNVTVVVFDSSEFLPSNGLHPNTQAIKRAAKQFLAALPADAPVAVYAYGVGDGLRFYVLRDVVLEPAKLRVDTKSPAQIEEVLKIYDIKNFANDHAMVQLKLLNFDSATLFVFESIGNHLGSFKGRKALVWVCPSWIPAIDPGDNRLSLPWLSAMSAVQRAEIALYPTLCDYGRIYKDFSRWAEFTGGHLYYGYDKIPQVIAAAQEDSQCYSRLTWERSCAAERTYVHKLSFQFGGQPEQSVLAPEFYFDMPFLSTLPGRLKAAESGLVTSLDATALTLNVEATRDASGNLKTVTEFYPGQATSINEKNDGLVDIIYAFYDSSGNRLPAGTRHEARFPIPAAAETPPKPEKIEQSQSVPPEAKSLRIVVRDAGSGALGSKTIPF